MKLPLIKFPAECFTYSPESKTFISDASDMENRHLQRMYDDADDRGFIISCGQFGGSVDITFVLSDIKQFQDDDGVASWEYVPSDESIRKYPECKDMKATVFND
jgi:hypothetical protein